MSEPKRVPSIQAQNLHFLFFFPFNFLTESHNLNKAHYRNLQREKTLAPRLKHLLPQMSAEHIK